MKETTSFSEKEDIVTNKIRAIDSYNSLIEGIKWKLFTGIGYEQDWELFYNKIYFEKWVKVTDVIIQKQIEGGNIRINKLIELKDSVEKETILNYAQKKLIKDRIDNIILGTQYHQNAIYIEAEKVWYPLWNKERHMYRKQIVEIENQLYWAPITEIETRKEGVINKLHKIYQKNEKELTEEEKWIWQKSIIEKYTKTKESEAKKQNKINDILIDEKNIFELVSLLLEIEWFNKEDIVKIEIDTNTKELIKIDDIYHVPAERKEKELYEYFNDNGIGQKFKIIKKNIGNNSVGITKENGEFKKNQICIGKSVNGKYSLGKKILPIIYDHEISTHVNTGIGNFKNIYIRDPERWDLEEGIALLNEKMSKGETLEDLYETSFWDIRMFLAEEFNDQELYKILEIYYKLMKQKDPDIKSEMRRARIWVPIWEKWARRKDLTYGNGKEIIKEMEELSKTEEGVDILNKYARSIYSTKLWYEAIKDIDNVLDGIKNIQELEPNFPIFAGKILYWKLFKGKLDKEKMLENDIRSVIKTNKDVTESQKRLLVKILQLIREKGQEENINSLESTT